MTFSEFTVKDQIKTDTSSALSWMVSHSKRHIWSVIGLIIPSFANAALAAWVPVLIGAAFDVFVRPQPKPDYDHLLWSTTLVVLTQ